MNDKAKQVLEAASTVFLHHGFSATTTDMIQQQAGVSKATVYTYFTNKETLFKAVVEAQCEKFSASLRHIEFVPGDLANSLRAFGAAYLHNVLSAEILALTRVVIAEAPRFPALARNFYLVGPQTSINMMSAHFAAACEAGEIDLQTPGTERAASLFLAMLRGEAQFACLAHPHSPPSPLQIDQWVNAAVTTFLMAFGKSARPAASKIPSA